MDIVSDPYDDARQDVDRLFKEAEALRARLAELGSGASKPASNEEAEWLLRELAPCLSEVDEAVGQLAAAVQAAERQRAAIKVEASELTRRKAWLQTSRGRLRDLQNGTQSAAAALGKTELWSSLKQKAMLARGPLTPGGKDPVDRIKANLDPDPKGKAVVDRELDAHNEPYAPRDIVTDQLDLQRNQLTQQDEDLDVLHGSIKRLGQVGLTIREELGQQAILLDELDDESATVQSKLKGVQKKMDKVAADMTLKSKLCVIFILVVILLFLLLILLYT